MVYDCFCCVCHGSRGHKAIFGMFFETGGFRLVHDAVLEDFSVFWLSSKRLILGEKFHSCSTLSVIVKARPRIKNYSAISSR